MMSMKMLEMMSRTLCRSFRVPRRLQAATSPCRPASSSSRCWTVVSQTWELDGRAECKQGGREGRRILPRRLSMIQSGSRTLALLLISSSLVPRLPGDGRVSVSG